MTERATIPFVEPQLGELAQFLDVVNICRRRDAANLEAVFTERMPADEVSPESLPNDVVPTLRA